MRTIRYLAVITALVLSGAADAAAQQAGLRTATVRGGGLIYDRGGDATHMMVGFGTDWTLTRHVLVEVEATWTPVKETWYDFNQPQARGVVRVPLSVLLVVSVRKKLSLVLENNIPPGHEHIVDALGRFGLSRIQVGPLVAPVAVADHREFTSFSFGGT